MSDNNRKGCYPFHEAQTAVNNGSEVSVNRGMVNGIIAVTGNAVNFSLTVKGKSNDTDDYTSISVINEETLVISPTITVNGKYRIGLTCYTKIQIPLTAIASGAVTVKMQSAD
jgi:hypothetical protein